MDPIALAALAQQQDDTEDYDAALASQSAMLDEQTQALMQQILGGRRRGQAAVPEDIKPIIGKLSSHPAALQIVPLIELMLANPLMIQWTTAAATAKLKDVQSAIDATLNQ